MKVDYKKLYEAAWREREFIEKAWKDELLMWDGKKFGPHNRLDDEYFDAGKEHIKLREVMGLKDE
jgi:hypothetical protein